MPKITRLSGASDAFELEFVEREKTPRELMRLSIQLHAAGLSLADTVWFLEKSGVPRARSTVHNWVQKADLQPASDRSPDHVAVDETVIHLDDERWWLYAAVDPDTNDILHLRLFTAQTTGQTMLFLKELREKHDVDDAVFLVDSAHWLKDALQRHGLRFHHETHGNRNTIERVFREIKRRTNQFSNQFRHASPETVETWLQTYALMHNQLN